MKKGYSRALLMAAAALALLFALGGCVQRTADDVRSVPQEARQPEADAPAENEDADAEQSGKSQVVRKMRAVTAEELRDVDVLGGGNLDTTALAAALNGAEDKVVSAEDAAALGFEEGMMNSSCWCLWISVDPAHETGVWRAEEQRFSICCGLPENIVSVELQPCGGSVLVQDETLYALVRHSGDYPENVDEAAYAQAKELIDARMEQALEEMRENPMEGTGCELTLLEKALDYPANEEETLELYRCRYAVTVAHPERDGMAGGRYLDSALRVQDGYHWAGHLGLFYLDGELKETKWYDAETLGDGAAADAGWLREWAKQELDATQLGD